MRLHLFYFVLCFILLSCQSDKYHWKNQDDRMVLMSGKTVVGELNPSVTKGMNRTDQIEMLDSCTFKITCQYTALEDMETARINLDFVHKSASDYWMIPSVSYNGNNWGRGKEPKGAQQNGKWRTYSYRSTPIPGATYSEGTRFAVAMWSDVPQNEKEGDHYPPAYLAGRRNAGHVCSQGPLQTGISETGKIIQRGNGHIDRLSLRLRRAASSLCHA